MQQRNTVATLIIFSLILIFFGLRIFFMVMTGNFEEPKVFRLWGIIVVMAIVGSIVTMILANIGFAIGQAVRTNEEPNEVDFMEDERDKLIELKSIRVRHTITTLGIVVAQLTFVFRLSPLVMFSLLIATGLVAQIISDLYRLSRYQAGV